MDVTGRDDFYVFSESGGSSILTPQKKHDTTTRVLAIHKEYCEQIIESRIEGPVSATNGI